MVFESNKAIVYKKTIFVNITTLTDSPLSYYI